MSTRGRRRYCVFGCADLGGYMHGFPHPERRPDMFQKWVSVVGDKIRETDPMKIYKNKKVCSYHFTLDQKVASHRLHISAVPVLNLDGKHLSYSNIIVQLEHNYCIPAEGKTTDQVRLTCQSKMQLNTTHTETIAQQSLSDRLNPPSTSVATEKEKSSEHLLKKHRYVQKQMRKLKAQLQKTKKQTSNYKFRIAAMDKALSDHSALNKVTKHMNKAARLFTNIQFRHAKKKPKGCRYNTEEKVLALSLYKKSPKGYSLLAKYFRLPSAKTLRNLLSDIQITPGINNIIFEKLKETVGGLHEQDRLCTLIFDEISIEPHVQFDPSNDIFKGFVSHDNSIKIANHALVFMVKGIKMNFKQPVAYYFVQSLKMPELKSILKEVIRYVHSTGLRILCTVCDQAATNVSTINSLVEETKASFIRAGKEWRDEMFCVDGKDIIPIFDVPHLIKGLRNNLLEKDLKYIDAQDGNKEKIVKWEYFEKLYEADKTCGELRCLHKLTEEHVYKHKIKKMRVKMAAQIFSHSVAATTSHLTERKILPEECRQLIPLVLMLDKLFDSLNAGTFHIPNGKIYKGGVRKNSPHHKLWQNAIQLLESIKFISIKTANNKVRLVETSAPSVKNFIRTIKGMQALWNRLNKKYSLDCMLTRNFNQDPAENFFGNIRSLGVRNTSPNCSAFEGAFKTLLLNNYSVQQSVNANCEEDFNACLQTLHFFLKENKNIENLQAQNLEMSNEIFEVITNPPSGDNDASVAPKQYVCGWVLRKCLQKIVKNCKNCRKSITAKNVDIRSYIHAKEYNISKKWLSYPSNQLVNSFDEIQTIVVTFLKTNFQKTNTKKNIKFLINTFVGFPFQCKDHQNTLRDYFIETSINVLIFSWCRNVNRILSGKIRNEDLSDPIKICAQLYYNTHKRKTVWKL